MPLREKAKNLFKTKSRSDSLSKTAANDDRDRYPSNIYRPEEMPKPKYRRPPQKEHKDKLEAFSFSDAWRKRSFQSTHSPGGTRMSSRRNSVFSMGRKSVGRKSVTSESEGGRSNSATSGHTDMSSKRREREATGEPVSRMLTTQTEQEGDDDVGNVGLSRVHSKDAPRLKVSDGEQANAQPNGQANGLHKTMSTAHDHQPFSEEDLAHAMQRFRLEVPAH